MVVSIVWYVYSSFHIVCMHYKHFFWKEVDNLQLKKILVHSGTETLSLKASEIWCWKSLAAQEGNQNLCRPQQDAERMVSFIFRMLIVFYCKGVGYKRIFMYMVLKVHQDPNERYWCRERSWKVGQNEAAEHFDAAEEMCQPSLSLWWSRARYDKFKSVK